VKRYWAQSLYGEPPQSAGPHHLYVECYVHYEVDAEIAVLTAERDRARELVYESYIHYATGPSLANSRAALVEWGMVEP